MRTHADDEAVAASAEPEPEPEPVLVPGLVLLSAGRHMVAELPYDDVVAILRAAPRPLRLRFRRPSLPLHRPLPDEHHSHQHSHHGGGGINECEQQADTCTGVQLDEDSATAAEVAGVATENGHHHAGRSSVRASTAGHGGERGRRYVPLLRPGEEQWVTYY